MNEQPENSPASETVAELEQRILAVFNDPHFRPSKPRLIANRLDLDSDQRVVMRRLIKRLVREGQLKWGDRHIVMKSGSGSITPPRPKVQAPRSTGSAPPAPDKPEESLGDENRRAERENSPAGGTASTSGQPGSSAATAGKPAKRKKNKPELVEADTSPVAGPANHDPELEQSDTASGDASPVQPRRLRNDEIIGVYRRASAGYGFVSPDGAITGDRSGDVFVPAGNSADAVDRDRVLVRIRRGRVGPRLKITGTVIEVVERKRHRFVGTLVRRGKRDFVEVDGNDFERPIAVGDASARSGQEGDKAVIEMVRFPSADVAGEAVIVELLGPRGKPGVDTQTILWQFDLPGPFSEEVLADTRLQASRFEETVTGNRVDLSADTIVTIDPATARDFDDAISLTRNPEGTWRLGVHIADVSHFVPQGSALDAEALARGNSVYLPDRVIPMLPETLSNGLASLQPDRLRYTMTVHMTVDDSGRVLDAEWCRAAIRSKHRFNYEEIDDYLANDQPWRERLAPDVFRLVRDMHSLAMKMRKRRMTRGSIDLTLPEVTIDLDENGTVCGAHVEANTESHQLIEEFMLAANEAVAAKLVDLGHLVLRRIHERPSERRLNDLTDFVQHLGIQCDSLEDRFEIKRIVALAESMPERQAIHMAVLRSMQKAVYSPKAEGHYALASKTYCHFTSPIRRYPDLVIHRMIGAILDGKAPRADLAYLSQVGQHCSETEVRAEQAERELIKLKLINYLSTRIGMEMDAVITGVESWGLFVQGIELPAEGLVPVDHLPYDQYTHDPAARTMSGRKAANQFRLGDRLRIVVEVADPDRRQLTFGIIRTVAPAHPRENTDGASESGSGRTERRPGRGHKDQRSRDPDSRRTPDRQGGDRRQGRSGPSRSSSGGSGSGSRSGSRSNDRSSPRSAGPRGRAAGDGQSRRSDWTGGRPSADRSEGRNRAGERGPSRDEGRPFDRERSSGERSRSGRTPGDRTQGRQTRGERSDRNAAGEGRSETGRAGSGRGGPERPARGRPGGFKPSTGRPPGRSSRPDDRRDSRDRPARGRDGESPRSRGPGKPRRKRDD